MANAYKASANIWVCDSPGTLQTDRVRVKNIRWDAGPTSAAGDKLIVQDGLSEAFFGSTADGPNYVDEQLVEGWVNGLKIAQLDHGIAYIELM